MNEDIIENKTDAEPAADRPSLVPGFKDMALRIGGMMIVVFAVRCISTVALSLLSPLYADWTYVGYTLLNLLTSIVFLNVIPITAGLFILKFPIKSGVRQMYAKPRYFGRSLGIFPAGYGLAMAIALITTIVGGLFEGTAVEDSFHAAENAFRASDMTSAVILFVHTAILAPLFEEFWFRGLVLQSLRPYGNGFAIFVSALMFGFTHANLGQFFYATTIGIVLGYVAVQTESIVTTTVMHAIFNSISGITSLFLANYDVGEYILALEAGANVTKTPVVIAFIVWTVFVLALAFIGFIMAVVKLIHIGRYRVPKVQTELSSKRRWMIFFSRPTVVIMLLMAFDTMTFMFVTRKLIELLAAVFYP